VDVKDIDKANFDWKILKIRLTKEGSQPVSNCN